MVKRADPISMDIYRFSDYKAYVQAWLESQPHQGRGLLSRIAEHIHVTPPMLSHVFKGDKHLSFEAANDLAEYLALKEDEVEYFMLLVHLARAGSFALKSRLERKVKEEQKKARTIANKVKADREVDEEGKVVFYSNWLYSAVRNMSACPDLNTVDLISSRLHLPRQTVQKVVDFLVEQGLCIAKKGELSVGPKQTHVPQTSPHVSRHHQNWRLQSMAKLVEPSAQNLFFTAPMSLSVEAADEIRAKIPKVIEEIREIVRPSDSEVVRCLNIDWFEY